MTTLPDAPMVVVTDLEVRRVGARVIAIPALTVSTGETLAIIGPNGSGKSTLLLALALLLKPERGTIRIAGETATAANSLRLRRQTAVVFQEPLLLDTSVANNVATGLKLRGMPRRERDVRVAVWLERFGIDHLSHRRARSLSGGEAQRASLARAFALEPKLLLLDEPFSALDAPTRSAVTADLLAVIGSTKTTTVLVTHDRDEALMFGDRVGVLIRGELRQVGPAEQVFAEPTDVEVAGFVGVDTVVAGVVVDQQDGLAKVQIGSSFMEVVSTLATGTPVMFCLRPEDVTLQCPDPAAMIEMPRSSARNQIRGQVKSMQPWGGQLRVTVDCGFILSAAITRRSASELGLASGTDVIASFKATSAHLLPRTD
jgi:tungstate transport system ATP-binding protein